MATLATIPLEILLLILQKLDAVDVVRLGMTCRDLHESAQTRHIWLDQTQNHRRRTVALKLSMPSPTTLPTEALKRFAILQAKLRARWNRSPDQDNWKKPQFAACGTTILSGRLDLILLPGGEFVISIDECDSSISLHRIKLFGGQLSLIRLTDMSGGELDNGEIKWNKILPAMAPNPVFSYARANRSVGDPTRPEPTVSDLKCFWKSSVYLFGIGSDGGVNLETEFLIPNRSKLLWVNGQGRIVGFVLQIGSESLVVTVVHLDHSNVTLEILLPSDFGEPIVDLSTPEPQPREAFEKTEPFPHVEGPWKVCFPTPDLAVICGRDRVLAYTLPSFSTLPHGKHSLDEDPVWSLSNMTENTTGTRRHQTSAEVFYDPSIPDRRYNIHFLRQPDDGDSRTHTWLTTLTIDPSDPSSSSSGTPAYQRIESHFSIGGRMTTSTLHPDVYHSRTQWDSEGLYVWVTSLEDIAFSQTCGEGEEQRSLCMFISNDELEPDMEWESVDLDEASGRIFIWGPAYRWMTPPETRIFVGELVL